MRSGRLSFELCVQRFPCCDETAGAILHDIDLQYHDTSRRPKLMYVVLAGVGRVCIHFERGLQLFERGLHLFERGLQLFG
jgi:hypothetical protein